MHKEEIIQIHGFLLHVRSFLEVVTNQKDADVFSSYEVLGVAPHHVFKSKDKQKLAVFELCKGISTFMTK